MKKFKPNTKKVKLIELTNISVEEIENREKYLENV